MANMDQLIDELAFGKKAPKPGPVLGLYLSPDVIYVSETHLEKGNIVVDHLVRIPVPAPEKAPAAPSATGTLNTDFLMNNDKLTQLIKQSMGSIKWSTKECIVTLSHHLGLLRYFAMPAVDKRFWAAAVPLEAKKYIPIPFDALAHDYQVVPLPPDATNKPRQGALICVTQRKNLLNISQLLTGLELKMIGMEVAPCSVLRLWEALDKPRQGKTHCQVHFDGGSIRILLADKGLPVFFRELFLGKEVSLGDLRKIDIGGCSSFAQKQLGAGQVGQAFVSGSPPNVQEWQDSFSKELNLPVSVHDTPQRLGIKGGDWGGYAAIGASLRLLTPSPVTLDLGQVGRISDEERRTARAILLLAAAVSLFFVAVGLYRNVSYGWRARELDQYPADPEVQAVFANKGALEIDALIKNMGAQAKAGSVVAGDTMKPTSVLQDLVNSLPDGTWLTDIHFKAPLPMLGMSAPLELSLGGRAKGASMSAEQDMAFAYKAALAKTPVIGKAFNDIQISVTGKAVDVDATKAMDPEALQERLEERTMFKALIVRKKIQ